MDLCPWHPSPSQPKPDFETAGYLQMFTWWKQRKLKFTASDYIGCQASEVSIVHLPDRRDSQNARISTGQDAVWWWYWYVCSWFVHPVECLRERIRVYKARYLTLMTDFGTKLFHGSILPFWLICTYSISLSTPLLYQFRFVVNLLR